MVEEGRFQGKIKFCSAQNQLFSSQYYHRKFTIDVQIAVNQLCKKSGIEIRLYHNYFEKQSTGIANGYRSLCSFEYDSKGHRMECDALMGLEHNGQKRLRAIEIYNDEKVVRILRTLEKYRQALSIGNPSLLFGVQSNTHILLFFRQKSMVERVKTRLLEDARFTLFMPYIHLLALNGEELEDELKQLLEDF